MLSSLFKEFLPEKILYLWNHWSIELLVLASLSCQVILTFNGSRRRNRRGNILSFLVWLAYLIDAKLTTVVLGKLTTIDIGRRQRNTQTEIQALLAPLMFMQIGNPDTITAYSIEDNQLGWRQVFNMIIQVAIMIYIIVRSWTDSKTCFLYLSMSVAGFIKYAETSWALKSALNGNFGLTNADFFKHQQVEDLFKKLPQGENELPQARLILRAYYRFCCLKPHLENWLYYPPSGSDPKKLYIEDCSYEDVFKITDCELGFMYDALYTKAPIIFTRTGFILRFISFLSLIATISGFSVLFKDAFVYNISVGFIYFVLIASVILEVYQILRMPFTDWAIVQLIRHCKALPILEYFLRYLAPQSESWNRWSNKMGQFKLLDFCMKTEHRNYSRNPILLYLGLDMKLRKELSLGRIDVTPRVKELVVQELKEINKYKNEKGFTKRGKWTIKRYQDEHKLKDVRKKLDLDKELEERKKLELLKELKRYASETTFDKSIFIWYITTNIFFHISDYHDDNKSRREAIMELLDYMMYLLVTRPHVLSITTGDIIFDHSCAKLGYVKIESMKGTEVSNKTLCQKLLDLTQEEILEINKQGEDQRSEAEKKVVGTWSLLNDIQLLAKSLLNLNNKDRWSLIGCMWVEMLGYAASNCEMEYHSELIRQGGEFFTHVWLIIAHTVFKYPEEFRDIHIL